MYRHKGVTVIENERDVLLISDKDARLVFTTAEAITAFFKIGVPVATEILRSFDITGQTLTEANIESALDFWEI